MCLDLRDTKTHSLCGGCCLSRSKKSSSLFYFGCFMQRQIVSLREVYVHLITTVCCVGMDAMLVVVANDHSVRSGPMFSFSNGGGRFARVNLSPSSPFIQVIMFVSLPRSQLLSQLDVESLEDDRGSRSRCFPARLRSHRSSRRGPQPSGVSVCEPQLCRWHASLRSVIMVLSFLSWRGWQCPGRR